MATAQEQSDLVMSTVVGLNNLAEDSYVYAKQQLNTLMQADMSLPLGVVDVDIGDTATISWTGGYTAPAAPVEPDYSGDIDDVTIPTYTAPAAAAGTLPAWSETAPTAPTAPTVPTVGTKPTLTITEPTVPTVSNEVTVGTAPSLSVSDPTIPTVTVPAGVVVGTAPSLSITDPTVPTIVDGAGAAPTWDADLSGDPGALTAAVFSAIPVLGTLPEIAVTIPTMDVSLLAIDIADDFVEPTYVERVSAEVEANIQLALGSSMGLPAGYWDSLWAQAAGDIAQQSVAEARLARNRGASSHWALPAETVLVGTRRIQEEASKKLTLAKLEQAKAAAVYSREDFWQAISKGIEYENQWINANDRVAQRALAAAEQFYGVRVQVHNANINRYNAMLDAARLDGTIDDMQVKRMLAKLDGELKASAQAVAEAGHTLNEYKTSWEGYKIEKSVAVQAMAEQVKRWNGEVDADIRYQALELDGVKVEVDVVKAKVQKFSADVQSWLGAVEADVKYQTLEMDGAKLDIDLIRAKVQVFTEEMRGWLGTIDADTKYQGLGLEASKLDFQYLDTRAKVFAEEMRGHLGTLDAASKYESLVLEASKTAIQVFETQSRVFSAEVQAWSAATDADVKHQQLLQGYSKLDIDRMANQIQQVQGLATATAGMLKARTDAAQLDINKQLVTHNQEKDINALEVDITKINQAAQEAGARIDIAQSQWAFGQSASLKTNIAQLAFGFSQAAVAASDVNLSSSAALAYNDSETASHNAARVW